ncbi:hypothetical protein M0R01_03085 [bacterium]|nr:hypothetical protein [bacterium]
MKTETKPKKEINSSKIIKVVYLYALGYFLVSNAWFCYFASQKTANKIVFYVVAILSIIFAILCFVKVAAKRGKNNNKSIIINTIIHFLVSVIIIYLGIKIICISRGGPIMIWL